MTRSSTPPPERPNPTTHPAAEGPLIERLINAELRRWLDTQLSLGIASEHTDDGRRALERVQSIQLAYHATQLTPRIVDALRRAGQLADPAGASR